VREKKRSYKHGSNNESDSLRAGRSGDRIPVEARFSATVQTGREVHPASYTMGTGSLPGVRWPRRGFDRPPTNSAEVKERLELYFYSPSGPSWPVLGWTSPLLYRDRAVPTFRTNFVRFLFVGLDEERSLQKKGGYTRRTARSHSGFCCPHRETWRQTEDELQSALTLTVAFANIYSINCFIRNWIIRKSRLTGKLTKVKSTLEQTTKAQRRCTGIALIFL